MVVSAAPWLWPSCSTCTSVGGGGVGPGELECTEDDDDEVVEVVGALAEFTTRSSSGSLDVPERKTKQNLLQHKHITRKTYQKCGQTQR